MESIVLLGFVALLAVLAESSLVGWPLLIWVLWWWSSRVGWHILVWAAVVFGVILDILLVKVVGVGAIGLWIFVTALVLIRSWFAGGGWGENVWVVLVSVLWGYWAGGIRGIGNLLVIVVLAIAVMWLGRRVGVGREIRLKR